MRIGELSVRTGVSQRMLRYYEQEGLLYPQRTRNGYREYVPETVDVVRHIRNLSDAGFKLSSIRILLPCLSSRNATSPQFIGCPEVRATLEREWQQLNAKVLELTKSRDAIAGFLDALIAEPDIPWTDAH